MLLILILIATLINQSVVYVNLFKIIEKVDIDHAFFFVQKSEVIMPAFAVYHADFEVVRIVSARSRGDALAATLNAAREAGYDAQWVDFRAKRAFRFDELANSEQRKSDVLGWHAKSYDLGGCFIGYDAYGCLAGDEFRRAPSYVYGWLMGSRKLTPRQPPEGPKGL